MWQELHPAQRETLTMPPAARRRRRRDPDFRESDYCREVLLGEGDVDWKKYLAVLDEIGYTGYLTIEREGSSTHDADVEKEVPFLKALIAE